MKTLAGVTILLSAIGFVTSIQLKDKGSDTSVIIAFFMLLLSCCSGLFSVLFLVWY